MKVLESPSFVHKNSPNENLFELLLLGFFILDDNYRKIHCPDCMFHSNYNLPKFEKLDLLIYEIINQFVHGGDKRPPPHFQNSSKKLFHIDCE